MPEVRAIALGVAMAGAEADRIARMPLATFVRATDRHGKAGPALGASADLALIARTCEPIASGVGSPGDQRFSQSGSRAALSTLATLP
jgi:hypothetical protein